MRIVCISDTHSMHRQVDVPDGDLLIHAGDSLGTGSLRELEDLDQWFAELPHANKILIAGNHDWCFEDDPEEARSRVRHAHYLEDSAIELEGLTFWGSPWTPVFFNWAFNLKRGKPLAKRWAKIPEATDILITHGPPAGILDRVDTQKGTLRPGCEDLAAKVETLELKLHIFGHIHEGHGQEIIDDCRYINASTCNGQFKPLNPPIVVDL
ncbi:metallophosphatase domain-containing protein [Marinobacter piscensis]|uniref:metallophosphatase domain-containing protein n=1 Tax=Marinobacter piscensis TaxID=1562308 RepID=UPI0011A80068|nr:metallophosphatase domain-containing protein [Marinobacter piscensis]